MDGAARFIRAGLAVILVCCLIGIAGSLFTTVNILRNGEDVLQSNVDELTQHENASADYESVESDTSVESNNKSYITLTYDEYTEKLNNERHQAEVQNDSWSFGDWVGLSIFVFGCLILIKHFAMSVLDSKVVQKATDAEFGREVGDCYEE